MSLRDRLSARGTTCSFKAVLDKLDPDDVEFVRGWIERYQESLPRSPGRHYVESPKRLAVALADEGYRVYPSTIAAHLAGSCCCDKQS